MDIKKLIEIPNSLSEKIIQNGDKSFKLWLEFEETFPWDDVENDFANIGVNMLDGRRYAMNVWTFKFLKTSVNYCKDEKYNLNGLYQIPPDIFVKELTRDCIEQTIIDLLEQGNLEELLNHSVFNLEFLEPYFDALYMKDEMIESLIDELKLVLSVDHELHTINYELIARETNTNKLVLELEDDRIAVVHLKEKSQKEANKFPAIRIYKDELDFWKKEMKNDILNF